ncbi:MAG: hypothetical protein AAF583_00680 [Pseudomonadota bacterium]
MRLLKHLAIVGFAAHLSITANAQSVIWPEAKGTANQDARVQIHVDKAKEDYARAMEASNRARELVAKLKNMEPHQETYTEVISDGLVFDGVSLDESTSNSYKVIAGSMRYPGGATAEGAFSYISYPAIPNWGDVVLIASEASPIETFEGEMARAGSPEASLSEGVVSLKNGDRFTGLFYSRGGASGMYERSDGNMTFIGDLGYNGYSFSFKNGVVQGADEKLVAVILD